MVPEPEPPIEVTRQFPPLGGDFCWEWRGNRGGLSGSELWRIGSKHGYFCLRRWPDSHPSPQVLAWIHSRLLAAHASGCSFVPAPMLTFSGVTAAVHENHLWELTPWMPGVADFRQKPSNERIRNALHSVARLHDGLCQSEDPHRQIASGIERRLLGIQPDRLSDRDLIRWNQAAVRHVDPEIATLCREIISRIPCWYEASDRCLRQAITIEVPLQACVRDLWHAHVLYTQDEVTGIIDFGAMRVDSVCADLTRLLGSFASGDPDQWLVGLAAYESRRPLSRLEKQLLPAFDLGTTLLSAVQWLRWLLDEQREFEDESLVRQRLRDVHVRLHRSPVELWNCLNNYVGS